MNKNPAVNRPSPRLHVILHLVTGGCLLLAAWGVGSIESIALHWFGWRRPLLLAGLLTGALAGFYARPGVSRWTTRWCLLALTLTGLASGAEALFRVLGHDFRRQAEALARTPPYYRKPTVPLGEVFFRREGPLTWTGPVIRQQLERLGLPADAYRDEPTVTVRYDSDGFRNDPPLGAWAVAVAGDSFVELGYLPQEELFTSLLAERLGRPVRNLGVSNTGPLTHLCYLEHFGLSPDLREAVIMFYEGNDLQDLLIEHRALERFRATGRRDYRVLRPQTSLLRALGEKWRSGGAPLPPPEVLVTNALALTRHGEVPVTLGHRLAPEVEPPADAAGALGPFLERFAAFGRAHGVRVWLAYMPCKTRVLEGRFRWLTPEDEARAVPLPTTLPDWIAEACRAAGVHFHDLTPALREAARGGDALVFNALYDPHLNARGAAAVAASLAERLAAP